MVPGLLPGGHVHLDGDLIGGPRRDLRYWERAPGEDAAVPAPGRRVLDDQFI
jgi:hypothetical protein